MTWSIGVYSRTTGVQSGSTAWADTETAGTGILASEHDTHDEDISSGLNTLYTNVQDGLPLWSGTSTGAANVYATSVTPALSAYVTGQKFRFLVGTTNTSTSTLNVDTTGAKAIQRNGIALAGGELLANDIAEVVYDGTQFQLTTPFRPAFCSVTHTSSATATASEVNPFDEDNHGTYASTANVTAAGITYAASTGRFTCTAAGIYLIQANHVVNNTGAGDNAVTIKIKVDDSDKHTSTDELGSSASDNENILSSVVILPIAARRMRVQQSLRYPVPGVTTGVDNNGDSWNLDENTGTFINYGTGEVQFRDGVEINFEQ